MSYSSLICDREESYWQLASAVEDQLPLNLTDWLLDRGSLTQKLKQFASDACPFRVQILSQRWVRPLGSECSVLGMNRHEIAMAREVVLCIGSLPWVYARTLMPASSLHQDVNALLRLGNKPLGDVLFTHPDVKRGEIEVSCLIATDFLYQLASQVTLIDESLWGRRTLFHMQQQPLLVNEFFLPYAKTRGQCV